MVLRDEESARPLRAVIGALLQRSSTADLALSRVRLAALDLTAREVSGPDRCRVLLGQLDATTLAEAIDPKSAGAAGREANGASAGREAMRRLAGWIEGGRLEVRSAGIGLWTPDFSIFRDARGAPTCLMGAHYFGSPHLTVGPSFTAILRGARDGALLQRRFDETWARGHDVAPAILSVLRRAAGFPHPDGSGVSTSP
jgi:hypothetical protein